MVRFAHLADVHLGGWKQPEMQELNFKAFQKAVEACIKERPEFILIAGDLFDSAYPPIEILKDAFAEFRKIKEARIPVFIIAGSHDSSASGKTFLDVLERSGFCKNVENYEYREIEDKIVLTPFVHEGIALYGYPGKRSGLEVSELKKVKFNDAPGMMKIFMLHTTLDKVKGDLPIECVESDKLPHADYYALGHIHIDYQYENFVYPGPIFPNSFSELEDLEHGGFYIVDTESETPMKRFSTKVKDIVKISVQVKDASLATDIILSELEKNDLTDKVVLLRISGKLEHGKNSDIKFHNIEEFAKRRNAYFLLKNIHDLNSEELELNVELEKSSDIELETIKQYCDQNPSEFNKLIPDLMNSLSISKQEDERTENFNVRVIDEVKKVLNF
ncbi:MAG: DNA repair exonuclease [Nanoarchaeota archaeon]|nr:DNA repair exonuclease [Nanoarchaeota archaeon]